MIVNTVVNNYLVGPETDSNFANTILLLSMDGVSGSTTFTDESFAAHGTASLPGPSNDSQVQTTVKKFGTGSVRLDSSGDALAWADHADWTLSGDFTIEGWFYFDTAKVNSGFQALASHYNVTGNQRGWTLQYRGGDATNNLRFTASSAGTSATTSVIVQGTWTPTADTWYFIVAERSGNTFRLYIDGTMLASASNAISIFNAAASLYIGDEVGFGVGFHGNMDEVRITTVARYASDGGHSVPTAAFPRS